MDTRGKNCQVKNHKSFSFSQMISTQIVFGVNCPSILVKVPWTPPGYVNKTYYDLEMLILTPCWICFSGFNPCFVLLLLLAYIMACLRESCPPLPEAKLNLFSSQGDNLSLPACEWLWHSWVPCVGSGTTCQRDPEIHIWKARIMDICDILVYWYGRRYSISLHLWSGCKEVKLTHPPPETCYSRRYLQESNGLFTLFSSLPPISDP